MENKDFENDKSKITKSLDEIITVIRATPDNDEVKSAPSEFSETLEKLANDLNQCKLKFGAQKYLIVCLGAVKAGKSTLLNALTGKLVSPAGAGVETTKHCSIILSADEHHPEGITLYRTEKKIEISQSEDNITQLNKKHKYIEELLDYFKLEKQPLPDGFQSSDLIPLTESRLEAILTKETQIELNEFSDFCLAEIRVDVPDDNILKEGVAFIDMPGLDGFLAGVDAKPMLAVLPQQCQHLLWVQSTVSALNNTVQDKLKTFINEKSEDIPIYCVLNTIKAKSEWHTPEAVEAACQEVLLKIKENLPKRSNRITAEIIVNAAMAWDACNINDEETRKKVQPLFHDSLREMSEIEHLIKALEEIAKKQKERIILSDAVQTLINLCEKINSSNETDSHEFINYKEKIVKDSENADDEKYKWIKLKNDFQKKFEEYKQTHRTNIINRASSEYGSIKKDLTEEIIDNFKVDHVITDSMNKNFDKKEREKYLKDWAKRKDYEFINAITPKLFHELGGLIADAVIKEFASLKNDLAQEKGNALDDLDFINRFEVERDRVTKDLQEHISIPALKDLLEDSPKVRTIGVARNVGEFLKLVNTRTEKEINYFAEEMLKVYKSSLKVSLSDSIENKLKNISTMHFDEKTQEINEKVKKFIENKIEKCRTDFDLNEKIKEKIGDIQHKIEQIKQKCEKLKRTLERK